MTTRNNFIDLDFGSNPALAALFEGKKVGDEVQLEVGFRIAEINDQRVSGPIKSVSAEEDDQESAEPSAEQPMMIAMNSQPEAAPEPEST